MNPAEGGWTLLRPLRVLHGIAAAAAPLLIALAPEPGVIIGIALLGVVPITGLLRPPLGSLSCCILAVQLVVLCLIRLLGGWPCDIACAGGGAYQHLLGMPVVWPACAAYLLLAWLVIRDARSGRWSRFLLDWAALLGGVSVFFLGTAMQLGMFCPFCLAVHLSMLLLLAVLLGCLYPQLDRGHWRAVLIFLVGALGVFGAYRWVGNVAPPESSHITMPLDGAFQAARHSAAYLAIDKGRRRGPADAPYRIDLIIDPHCELCAQEYDALVRALRPLTEGSAPRLCLVTSFLIRPEDAAAADLIRHLLAAAALGPATFRAVLDVSLGSDAKADFAALSSRIAEVEDPTIIQRTWIEDQGVITLLQLDDSVSHRQLHAGPATPQVILTSRQGGALHVLAHWSGRIDIESVAQEVQTHMAPGPGPGPTTPGAPDRPR